ncbi:hypothetical protein BD626DRAFT_412511 [Schizophyllum amplum]|uniref:CxC2-like cysteine cluster KDZ transposase-associated domain-containing protein n=1 Tax=Schizophyllum amplum TaxID=97359 RepID=A0A550BXA2_9AGAR|nr:hypothetical protein BD626DRAFT_412511 [Auriculariopsis ampla]
MVSGSFTRAGSSRTTEYSQVSRGTTFTENNRRLANHNDVLVPVARRRRIFHDEDSLTRWEPTIATSSTDPFEDYLPFFLMGEGVSCEDQEVDVVDERTGKRKRYASDNPMSCWRPLEQKYLHELLRHEGLGSSHDHVLCATCKSSPPTGEYLFKCEDCGVFLQCRSCCLARHTTAALHHISRWTGDFWDKSTSLTELGLVYQVGHGGLACPAPRGIIYTMTVIAPTHICRLKIRYCACSRGEGATNVQQLLREGWFPATVIEPSTCALFTTLDHFALLTVIANTNVRDFVSSLQCSGNALRLLSSPECYRAFGTMSRQWTFLHRMKRAGRAHDARGIAGTLPGEAAVRCWACPQDGVNMPPTWREDDRQYIHKLFLSMDANFRLKNRFRKNARSDAPLAGGSGSVVEPSKYKQHLKGYVNEEDVSTCIAFAALLEKDTKLATGCRVSGCGACSCTRHETIRPNGLGDLQKGERYANMDFILWSAIKGEKVDNIMLTYDIGCQWKKNLYTRVLKLPEDYQPIMRNGQPIPNIDVRLPVWHGNVHEIACRTANSMRYAGGAGKPDGEGPERIWAAMNSMASATKEMGEGVRDGVIEGWTAHHNTQKNVAQRTTLEHRTKIAHAQSIQRTQELYDIESALDPDTLRSWRAMYTAFEGNKTLANPFMPHIVEGPSEQTVRAQLVRDEAEDVRLGRTPMRATAKATFVVLGLQLEEQQRRIASMARDATLAPLDHDRKLQEQRIAWFKRLARYRTLQELFMPAAAVKALAAEQARDADVPAPDAENVKIWLPSDLTREERDEGCVEGLPDIEVSLRVAACTDTLKDIRNRIYARRFLINERNANVVGQRDSTRARSMIARLDERIVRLADKYRAARGALFALKPSDDYPAFKELKDGDLTIDDDREADGASTEQLNNAGGRGSRAIGASRKNDGPAMSTHDRTIASVRAADSRRNLTSWIWTALGGPDQGEEAQVHDAVRVEWAKARARSEHWHEEVNILKEEMRRVLRYLQWRTVWWETRATFLADLDPAGRAGVQAYAKRQAHLMQQMQGAFYATWSAGSGRTALVDSAAVVSL